MTGGAKSAADVLIRAEGVSKAYCRSLRRSLWYGLQDVASEFLLRDRSSSPLRRSEFWAVEEVSVEVRRGECLGLIGHNGAGKTTLLKLLNGLVKPDRGLIETRGRVGALIELGVGGNPILTGRENIYVSAAVLGLSRRETDERLNAIVEFADLGEFIDSPVRNYSSGMKMRLGFAVAAHLEPDILLIDEILAVGDAGFRVKCYNKIDELRQNCAIVFVSHAMPQVARLAQRTAVLNKGKVEFQGSTADAIDTYYSFVDAQNRARYGSGQIRIDRFDIIDDRGDSAVDLRFGLPFSVRLEVTAKQLLPSLVVDVVFHALDGSFVAECNNYVRSVPLSVRQGVPTMIEMRVPCLTLNPGRYRIGALLLSEDMTHHFDWIERAATISVGGGRPAAAGLQFLAEWRVETRHG